MPTCVKEETPNIFPLHRLALLLATCLGLSWFMVPKQDELVERLIKDKQYDRVVALLQSGDSEMKSVDLGAVRKLDAPHLAFIIRLLKLTPREQLHAVFDDRRNIAYDSYLHHVVLGAIRYVNVIPPKEAYEFIAPRLSTVPESWRLELLRLIARNAEATGSPALAANALQFASTTSTSDWLLVQDLARDYRWSNKPDSALAELEKWLHTHEATLKNEERSAALDLHFTLALECGRPSSALDVCLDQLRKLPAGSAVASTWLERARSTALACSRTNDLIEPLRKHVDALPESRLTDAQLHGAHSKEPDRLDAFERDLTDLAHWSDWSSHFNQAYAAHEKLAALGSLESLDRCLELQTYLGRGTSCAALLKTLGDVPERPKLLATLAHILAENGENSEACACFDAWMKKNPDDLSVGLEHAALLDDMGDHAAALAALEALHKHQPADAGLMKKLAEARIRCQDYAGALALYEKLPAAAHTEETLENYEMIAESLDNHAAQFNALKLTLQVLKRPDTKLFLNLASAASYLSDDEKGLSVLRDGLTTLPKSAALRIALADALTKVSRTDDALETLLKPSLKNNFEAVQSLLSMVRDVPDAGKILAFVGADIDRRLPLTTRSRIHLAELFHITGHTSEERRIYASVPEAPENLRLLAESRYFIDDLDNASRLLLAHLHSHPRAPASEWMFLGDILEKAGHAEDAQKAYDHYIALLTENLPDTASN